MRVIIGPGGWQVAPFGGAHVLLDGQPLDLVPYAPPDAALHPAEDGGGLEFNRPPRLLPPDGVTRLALPHPPGKPERRPVPVLMAVVRDAATAADAERLRRRHDCPDPAAVSSIAAGPRRRLWERRRTDPDYLLLRLGTAGLPWAVELTDLAADEVQVCVLTGTAGQAAWERVRWLPRPPGSSWVKALPAT